MRVIKLTLAYDGTDFRGWALQRDPGVRTVEGSLVEVLTRVVRHDLRLSVAGRTDAGVHARGQVASFSTSSHLAPERIQKAANGLLSPEIVVVDAREAREGFDARFSATAREYVYVIDSSPVADPFTARYLWHRPTELSIARMRVASRHLVGEHDFTSFCRHPGHGKPTVRHLQRVSVSREGSTVRVRIRANAFLHQMVRTIVGTLVRVGEGRLEPQDVQIMLEARKRDVISQPAPPRGLTLEHVSYGSGLGTSDRR
ncbi:MAG: tRNA pseudouridine(38-40) synthase TruA [Actinomycetota bacterium]